MSDAKARVLVVDDERFFREAIGDVLSAHGYPFVACEDGERALKLVVADNFAVAVLDIRLPGIDGIEVLRQLRVAQPELRVIMLSASTDQELVLEALRLGACDYLAKPLHDEELVLAVRRAADTHRIASDWGSLRIRLDELVGLMEDLSNDANDATPAERLSVIREAAVRAVSIALRAEKTSLLLLNDDASQLDVVASLGRDVDPDRGLRVEPSKTRPQSSWRISAMKVISSPTSRRIVTTPTRLRWLRLKCRADNSASCARRIARMERNSVPKIFRSCA